MASEKPLEKSPEPLKKEGFGEWGGKGFGVRIPDFLPFFSYGRIPGNSWRGNNGESWRGGYGINLRGFGIRIPHFFHSCCWWNSWQCLEGKWGMVRGVFHPWNSWEWLEWHWEF